LLFQPFAVQIETIIIIKCASLRMATDPHKEALFMLLIQASANIFFKLLKFVLAFKTKKKSTIYFCFKAEKHLIQPGQKDPQH
jgi:hypothetical protein